MFNRVKYVTGSKYASFGVGTLGVRPAPPALAFLNCDGGE